jgi:hypothetical protein
MTGQILTAARNTDAWQATHIGASAALTAKEVL